jgi:hypothetical protein
METIPKSLERTPERSRLRFWGLVLLLGPLPVCGSFALLLAKLMPNEIGPVPTCGFFGALWGLASGVRSRKLSRAILGLNGGVLMGSAAGWIIEDSGSMQRAFASIVVALSMGLLTGLLRMQPPDRVVSFFKGTAVGFSALLVMCITFFGIIEILPRFMRNEWVGVMFCGFVSSALGVAILLRGMRSEGIDSN